VCHSSAIKTHTDSYFFLIVTENVTLCDLFRAAGVCRKWKLVFEGSGKLQRKARLISDDTFHEDELEIEDIPMFLKKGMLCRPEDVQVNPNRYYYFFRIHVCPRDGYDSLRTRLSNNIRRCFATQPAVKTLMVEPRCCRGSGREELHRETGVTIGDVFDAFHKILGEHEHCPELQRYIEYEARDHRTFSKDNIYRYPEARGEYVLPDTHPEVVAARERVREAKEKAAERASKHMDWSRIWQAYHETRRDDPRPTWPKFLAENRHLLPQHVSLNECETARCAEHGAEASAGTSTDA
jgi:hypothetical protein